MKRALVLLALRVGLIAPDAAAAPKPAPLACLERFYAVRAIERADGWAAQLPDGTVLPYDDGRAKTVDERLERPDVKDAFAQRYPRGAIAPVLAPDEDPGRVRLDALFRATYPPSELTRVDFLGRALTVHRKVVAAFARVAARLQKARAAAPTLAPFLEHLGGTFAPRKIAGTDRTSAHAWGVSIDLNPSLSSYWRWQRPPAPLRWQNRVPQAIVDAFEAEGFIWGGRWYHYDTMHFEYRPELLDPACYQGSSGPLAR